MNNELPPGVVRLADGTLATQLRSEPNREADHATGGRVLLSVTTGLMITPGRRIEPGPILEIIALRDPQDLAEIITAWRNGHALHGMQVLPATIAATDTPPRADELAALSAQHGETAAALATANEQIATLTASIAEHAADLDELTNLRTQVAELTAELDAIPKSKRK